MEGEFDQSQLEGGITGEPAANPVGSLDLDKFRDELLSSVTGEFDKRFSGFQKTLAKRDEKISELERMVQEANRADLTEDQRTALDVQEKDAQIARLQMALELKELEREFPQAGPVFGKILEADSPRAQMEILNELLSPRGEETPTEQPEAQPTPASVDPNNPPDTGTDGMSYEAAFEKDPSLLDRILKGAPRLRGLDE